MHPNHQSAEEDDMDDDMEDELEDLDPEFIAAA